MKKEGEERRGGDEEGDRKGTLMLHVGEQKGV